MQTLIVTFEDTRAVSAGDAVNVYWNVDRDGLAAGAVGSVPVNDSPLLLFPGIGPGPKWGRARWGRGPWGGRTAAPSVSFETPAVCFGQVIIAGQAVDAIGNAQAGALEESTEVVNSTPQAPTDVRRASWANSRQAFTLRPSPQVK